MLRRAQFAGGFYDASPERLRHSFDKWFATATLPEGLAQPLGVIVPHAGYIYSGACAAYAYKLLSHYDIHTAVLIHPSHRANHFGYSVSPYTEYQTPLGQLKRRDDWAEGLSGAETVDSYYHQNEHSMEVQLPFLVYIKPQITVLPVMIGRQSRPVSEVLANEIFTLVKAEWKHTIIIVSTDLSHYHNIREAERLDKALIEHLTQGRLEEFYDSIVTQKTEACGYAGVLSLMYMQKKFPSTRMVELHYTHSGFTSGDFSQVVGYLAAAMVR